MKSKRLREMTDEEFVNHMLVVRDPLTTTELELECFTRLVGAVKKQNPNFNFFTPPTEGVTQ